MSSQNPETEQQPEKKANPAINVPAKLSPVEKLLHSLRQYTDLFTRSVLTPSVITVLITAIVAPFAVDKINSDMENKKLQKQVIEKMLDYTAQTDFSKPEALEKITIISKMVDENKPIFGLSFSKTDDVIQNLYGEVSKVGLANLNKKRKEFEEKISQLKKQLETDTVQIASFLQNKQDLEAQLLQTNTAARETKLKKDIQDIEIKLKPLLDNKNVVNKQIAYWEQQIASLNKDIADAQQDLATLLQNKREREAELKRSLENKGELEENFKNVVNQNNQLVEQMNKMDTVNKALASQVQALQKELETLKDKEKLLLEQLNAANEAQKNE